MILKNSLNFITEFFNYSSNQIRKIYLSSRIYNKKISKIDDKLIEYKPSPNLLDCLIKYEKKKNNIEPGKILNKNSVHHEEFGIITKNDMIINEKTKLTIDELRSYYTNWLTKYMS